MNDMTSAITPKSDQLNADDLITGPRTILITRVSIRATPEQPVSIHFEGDSGKPWKPCKSMSRVLVAAWGPDANAYAGRSVTLYRDPKVKWGGLEVGGIRVSHLSHIERDMTMALTETKGKRSPFLVKVLSQRQPPSAQAQTDRIADGAEALLQRIYAASDAAGLEAITEDETVKRQRAWLAANRPDLAEKINTAVANFADDPFAEGRADSDHGERFNGTDEAGGDTPHPMRAIADELIGRCADATIIGDVIAVESEFAKHRDVTPEDIVAEVDAAVAAGRARFKQGGK